MRYVSQLLKNVIYPVMHYCGGLKRLAPSSGCAVVNYHGVFPSDYDSRDPFLDGNLVSQDGLQRQLRFLKQITKLSIPKTSEIGFKPAIPSLQGPCW